MDRKKASDKIVSQERREHFGLKARKAVDDYYKIENPNNEPFVPKWLDERAKQICRDTALEELTEQAEVSFKAGIKEAGLQLRARIGGVDEFIDWSDEGLRQFRKMTLQATKDLLKEWGLDE